MGQSNFSDCFSSSFLKMEDLQLTTLRILVFFFSKTRKSMNMPISASKKEHLFSRIKGCLFIINVGHTKTVFSSLLDEIGWFKNNRQFYLQYIVLYVCIYMVIWLYSRFLVLPSAVSYQYIYYIIYNMFNIYIYKLYIYIYIYISKNLQFSFSVVSLTFGLKTIITVFQICTEILHYLNIWERAYSLITNNNTRS